MLLRLEPNQPIHRGMLRVQLVMCHKLKCLLLVSLLIAGCHPTRGCLASEFVLSPESPLPKWFMSSGVPRSEAAVTMDYWRGPLGGGTAVFTLRNASGKSIAKVVGHNHGNYPFTLEPYGETGPIPYPIYSIITAHGITEVIEHRKPEPVFRVATDPETRRKILAQMPAKR